ncbi:MAG: hypothetical protein K9L78_05070 [Victivallales bacterium]|nr:hypothetical protein [Victivallales bacterium]MCF7889475.1 hypothetical protein [Victivallales bacterium]
MNKLFYCFAAFLIITVTSASKYNFKNDYKYKKILNEYNILANRWTVTEKQNLPAELLKFRVTEKKLFKNAKSESYLVPLEVLEFDKDQMFCFFWYKNKFEAGSIIGRWEIENSMLILTLTENYVKPYLKDRQLRYEIKGTNKAHTKLYFKGKTYPKLTDIINTSNHPLKDFEKIIIALEQKSVSQKYPSIIKEKELQLKKSIEGEYKRK